MLMKLVLGQSLSFGSQSALSVLMSQLSVSVIRSPVPLADGAAEAAIKGDRNL